MAYERLDAKSRRAVEPCAARSDRRVVQSDERTGSVAIAGGDTLNEQDKASSQAGWIGMLVFAAGFACLGVWGWATGQVVWGVSSVLFGLVWGLAALRVRRKARAEGAPPSHR
jgi:hypothetical protein